MLLLILAHILAKEVVQSFWMMWPVLEMRADLWTANTLLYITVFTIKMLELVANMNVSVHGPGVQFSSMVLVQTCRTLKKAGQDSAHQLNILGWSYRLDIYTCVYGT